MNYRKITRAAVILIAAAFAAVVSCRKISAESVEKPIDMILAKKYISGMNDSVEKKQKNYRLEIEAMADYAIITLRGPKTDGSGYRFAKVSYPKNSPPEVIADAKLLEVFDVGKKQSLKAETRVTNRLQIHLPKYRSGMFKNNGDAYVHGYTVEYMIDGKKYTIAKEFKNWLKKTESIDIPLPGLAEWASIVAEFSVSMADIQKTYVQLAAFHPDVDDDPANPFSYSIGILKSLRKNASSEKSEEMKKLLAEAERGIDAVPAAIGANLPPEKQIAMKLDEIIGLLNDNSIDKAKEQLKDLADSVK